MTPLRRWVPTHQAKLVQALRMTVSSLAAFALAWAFDLAQGFWAVVTALIVTQGSVGGSLKAAWDRFLGSVSGAVYGGAVAFLLPHEAPLLRALALALAVAPLSVMAAFSAGFRVAPITAIIVLLTPAGATLGPLGFAADRVLEIGLGCAVGLLVSVAVAPARASRSVLETAGDVAALLARQLAALAAPGESAAAEANALATPIRKGLTRLDTLVTEAARERRSHLTAAPDPEPLLRTLRRLRHDLVMLRRAAQPAGDDGLAPAWIRAAQAGSAALAAVAHALPRAEVPGPFTALAAAAAAYRAAVDRLQVPAPGTDAAGRVFGTLFALDQFRRDLDDLVARAGELAAGRSYNR